ncbi:hypothetical protein C7G41_07025 [Bradyrhizobium sp. MOS002]|nr:hypothetical protein C7G41_07025 [Bradyrhizobium sp. MOS002]
MRRRRRADHRHQPVDRRRLDRGVTDWCHAPRRRGIQYAAASRYNYSRLGVLDRPVNPGDDSEDGAAFFRSRRSPFSVSRPAPSRTRRTGATRRT